DVYNRHVIVVLIHLLIFWIISDLVAFTLRKILKKERNYNIEGICAIIITVIVLGAGWHNAHSISETYYTFSTPKNIEPLRIVGIADAHLGITLDAEKFSEQIERINNLNPDIVIIAGDFVDDDSTRKDMTQTCQSLGNLKTKYGVYFSYGNHDRGYYNSRDFTFQELETELKKNNVTVLKDESVEINDCFYITGRLDNSFEERLDVKELTENLDTSKYSIMLDHQPNDYANQSKYGVDLVFSGHTHGGHIFPTGYVGLLTGMNDRVYGTEKRNNTDFVVTSGISGWVIPFKTGTKSEIVIMDILPE
ncbi:MAG: metallophosphoesterase, partial [Ruminococcus sp.]|nr:metallophosphoesterase [Ruminococcus sp.]